MVSRSPPCNYASILDPNQSLLSKHPYFLPAPILILNNLCNFLVFACVSLPHFVAQQNTIQVLLESVVSQATVLYLAQIKLFSIPKNWDALYVCIIQPTTFFHLSILSLLFSSEYNHFCAIELFWCAKLAKPILSCWECLKCWGQIVNRILPGLI